MYLNVYAFDLFLFYWILNMIHSLDAIRSDVSGTGSYSADVLSYPKLYQSGILKSTRLIITLHKIFSGC